MSCPGSIQVQVNYLRDGYIFLLTLKMAKQFNLSSNLEG